MQQNADVITATKESCTCDGCQNACRYKPGWFLPGQAERVAEYLNITLNELFATRLGVDWYTGDSDTFLLAPALVESEPGREYPADPRGTCTFYRDGLCEIHPVRPFECAEYLHGEDKSIVDERHASVAEAWQEHQAQIVQLLSREPESESFTIFDYFLGHY